MASNASKKMLYALLVGINEYDQVRKLRGCLNDVAAVKKYLTLGTDLTVAPNGIKELTDAEATRQGIQDAFRNHLVRATAEDTVLFYFSGHGTREVADPIWEETGDALECIVCYDGGAATTADFLLTDKELRFLIHALYQHTKAHIVTIFDCCHAGDNTRNGALMLAGNAERSERRVTRNGDFFPKRNWNQFLFSDRIAESTVRNKKISEFLPQGVHVQMAACESNQVALEEAREGVFTRTLLKTLRNSGGNITYNTLRSRVRQDMRAGYEQTPRIYAPIDPERLLDSGFLNRAVDPQKMLCEAAQNGKGQWQLNVGAIHGVDANAAITLVDPADIHKSPAVTIPKNGVFIDYTRIEGSGLESGTIYKAEVSGLLSQALKIETQNRDATPEEADRLRRDLEKKAGGGFVFGGEKGAEPTEKDSGLPEEADYTLHLNGGEAYLTLPGDPYRPLIRPIPFLAPGSNDRIASSLRHISRWHFIKNLRNKNKPENFPEEPLKIEVVRIRENGTTEQVNAPDGTARLQYEKTAQGWKGAVQIKITNTTAQQLYVSAAYLPVEFRCFLDFLPQRVQLLEPGKSVLLGRTTNAGKKLDEIKLKLGDVEREYNWKQVNETLKFIVSTTEFNAEALTLEGLPQPLTTKARRGFKGLDTEEDDDRGLDTEVEFSGWVTQTLGLVFENPVYNQVPASTLDALLNWEETAYFAAGLYGHVEKDERGLPTIWKPKEGIVVPEDEKGLLGDLKLKAANLIETLQRRKRYKNLKKDPSRLRIVAEGDSWFQYPILLQDTLDQLYKRYAVCSFAEAGDTLTNYLKEKEYLEAIGQEGAKFFLVSGGGNDILGEEFQHFLRDAPDPNDTTPKRYLNHKFDEALQTLVAQYTAMFSQILTRYKDLHILLHCYDYIIPVDTGVHKDKTSWSGKYMVGKNIAPQSVRGTLIKYIVDQFAGKLKALVAGEAFRDRVVFIDTRGLVNSSSWYDEIHPTSEGFELVADKFIAEIERIKAEKKITPGMQRTTATTDPVDFVRNLEIGPLANAFSTSSTRSLTASNLTPAEVKFKEGVEQSFIDAKSMISFASGVSGQQRSDLLNSVLLAQLAASKQCPGEEQTVQWYETFVEVLRKTGWVIEQAEFSTFESNNDVFELENVIIDILTAAFGGAFKAVITETLKAIKALGEGDTKFTVFEKNTHSLSKGAFQIGLASEKNGAVHLQIGTFLLTSNNEITKILFYKSTKDKIKLEYCSRSGTLHEEQYARIRAAIEEKLADKATDFIAEIEI